MMSKIPWPNIRTEVDDNNIRPVPLHEEYSFSDMAYLDTPEAKPIFETQANIIIKNKSKGIVDIGCRHGPVLQILQEKGYNDFYYMGFDTSIEPIKIGSETWKNYPNIEFRHGSWNDEHIFDVDFDVDQVIWSGVLLYRPNDHLDFFLSITKEHYKSKHAIIQEPMKDQRHWRQDLILNTIADQLESYKFYCKKVVEHNLDLEIFAGKRVILDVEL